MKISGFVSHLTLLYLFCHLRALILFIFNGTSGGDIVFQVELDFVLICGTKISIYCKFMYFEKAPFLISVVWYL